MSDPNGEIRAALFSSPGPVIERAVEIVEHGTGYRPDTVTITWLGRRTAMLVYRDEENASRVLTARDGEADELRALEEGTS